MQAALTFSRLLVFFDLLEWKSAQLDTTEATFKKYWKTLLTSIVALCGADVGLLPWAICPLAIKYVGCHMHNFLRGIGEISLHILTYLQTNLYTVASCLLFTSCFVCIPLMAVHHWYHQLPSCIWCSVNTEDLGYRSYLLISFLSLPLIFSLLHTHMCMLHQTCSMIR